MNALSIYVSRNENPYLTTQEFEQAEKLLYPHMSADNSTELQPTMRQECIYVFTGEDTNLHFIAYTPLDIMLMATHMVSLNCQEERYMLNHDGTPVYGDEIGCSRMVWRIQELVRARRRTKEEKEEIEGIDAPLERARRLELNNRVDNMLLSIYYLSVLVIWHRDMEGHLYEMYETYSLPSFDLEESLDRMQVKLID